MHRLVIVALDDVVPADVAMPYEVFSRVRLANGAPGYRVRVCGVRREVTAGPFHLQLRHGLDELTRADTVLLAGVDDPATPVPDALVQAVQRAARRGARVVSVCSGAFLLAATGLLDGRRATTHWLAAEELARRYPKVRVDANVLYVDEGQVLTSAGAAAAMDLCLYMVRRDHGPAAAADAARLSVVPLERDGGQAQFIAPRPQAALAESSLAPLLRWLDKNLHKPLTLERLASRAALSVRSLNRRFHAETGTTPLQYLLRARVRRAQQLLETTGLPLERIADQSGFGSVTALREHFRRLVTKSPQAYRRAFRGQAPTQRAARLRGAVARSQARRAASANG